MLLSTSAAMDLKPPQSSRRAGRSERRSNARALAGAKGAGSQARRAPLPPCQPAGRAFFGRMVRLNDAELALVMTAARALHVEERDGFLRLLATELARHRDIYRAIRETQQRLLTEPAA